jgi:hypothetical protein
VPEVEVKLLRWDENGGEKADGADACIENDAANVN